MKAVILAAGRGTRMGPYTDDLPKGMLPFDGMPLIGRQIEALRLAGVEDIHIVTGYEREAISYDAVSYYHNAEYATTNMVESLMCAREVLDGDVLVAYADIVYTPTLVQEMEAAEGELVLAVDAAWRAYWALRYGTTECDLETLTVDDGLVTGLGREVESSEGIDHRYIGLIKFTAEVWPTVFEMYDTLRTEQTPWKQSGKTFRKGYMTDLLHVLIERGTEVRACVSERQWLEFDTAEDYEKSRAALEQGRLSDIFDRFW